MYRGSGQLGEFDGDVRDSGLSLALLEFEQRLPTGHPHLVQQLLKINCVLSIG